MYKRKSRAKPKIAAFKTVAAARSYMAGFCDGGERVIVCRNGGYDVVVKHTAWRGKMQVVEEQGSWPSN